MSISGTFAGTLVGAILALTWVIIGFWAFLFVLVAMGIGAVIGRTLDGKLDVGGVIEAFRGKRSSS